MRLVLPIALVFLVVLSSMSISGESPSDEMLLDEIKSADQYDSGFRFNNMGWIYVHIEGEPYERGFQHGYLLAHEIVDMVERWSHLIHNYWRNRDRN